MQLRTQSKNELAALKKRNDLLIQKNIELQSEIIHLRHSLQYFKRVSVERGDRVDKYRELLYDEVRPLVAALLSREKLKKSAVRKLADFFGLALDDTP